MPVATRAPERSLPAYYWPSARRYVRRTRRTTSVRPERGSTRYTFDVTIVIALTNTVNATRVAADDDPFAALDAFDDADAAAAAAVDARYLELPHQCGGAPPSSAEARVHSLFAGLSARMAAAYTDERARRRGYACADATCAGPNYCVHHWLAPVALEVAAAHVVYAHQEPLFDERRDDIERGAAAVEQLLRLHVSPATLRRAGADVGRLSALGYTLEALVTTHGYELEALVDGLALDSTAALVALRFTPLLWRDRAHFPVVVFTERVGVRAHDLAGYKLSYTALVDAFGLALDELVLLGYTAPVLVAALGMAADDVVRACGAAELGGYGAAWTYAALGWSGELFDALMPARTLTSDAYERFADVVAVARYAPPVV